MGGKIDVYDLGGGGCNLVKDPLQLDDNELTQAQNAELVPDGLTGGEGSISKRGGLQSLNGTPLAGSILGMVSLPLQTTYVRTLYVAYGDLATGSVTFKKTTDGTSWSSTISPLLFATQDKYDIFSAGNGVLEQSRRRGVSYKQQILYPGNDYTEGTSNPLLVTWNGTDALTYTSIPPGPNSTTGAPPAVISEMLAANGVIYLAVVDPAYSGTHKGRVLALDPRTGSLTQVANAFGVNAGEQTGGAPFSLAWYNGQLWVGQASANGGDLGYVSRCYPDTDTAWTADVITLDGFPMTILPFKGDLYVGRWASQGDAGISKRTASTGVWSSVDNWAGSADAVSQGLIEYNSTLYYAQFDRGGAHKSTIRKSTDGTTWSTDLDIEATYTKTAGTNVFDPRDSIVYNSDLFFSYQPSNHSGTEGFVVRLHAGVWSRVITDENVHGAFMTLVERS